MTPEATARFWSKVDKNGETQPHTPQLGPCWRWLGKLKDGYGRLAVDGSTERAHRASWRIHHGEVASDICVLHRCDNRACVRPDHLFLGTRADNIADCISKGRFHDGHGELVRGERNPHAKLTARQAAEIRMRYRAGEAAVELAAQYGVHRSSVLRIARGGEWGAELQHDGEQRA